MAIGYSQEGYRPTTALANLTSQGIGPIDVTRGGGIRYAPLTAISIPSSQPELVAQGIASGITSAASGALSGIKAKWESEQALKVAEAKKAGEYQDVVEQEIAKFAIQHSGEADLSDRLQEIRNRFNASVPAGYVKKEDESKPATTQPQAQDFVHPIPVPPQTPQVAEAPLPVKDQQPNLKTPVAEIPTAPSAVVTAQEEDIPPYVPATQTLKPLTAPAVQPPVSQQVQPVLSKATLLPASGQQLPEQPQDLRLPRYTKGLTFEPQDPSSAFDAASRLTTPYWKVSAEQDQRTKKWYLKQEDTSAEVRKVMFDQNKDERDAEKLVLEKRADERAQQKADQERLDSERKRLKEDSTVLNKQKNNIQKQSNKLDYIDRAIESIESDDELVGLMSEYLLGKKQLPFVPGQYPDYAIIASQLGYKGPKEKLQKIIDLENNLETIRSNLGWEAFAELKELSPTGSAGTGAFTEGERKSLERIPGSLDITQSPENLKKNLYNLKNAAIKTILNASSQVSQVDPSFKKPIISKLKFNPDDDDKINQIRAELDKATPEQEKSVNYKNAVEKLEMLMRHKASLDELNKQ